MHPAITAWLEYKRLADIQVAYGNRQYAMWISACVAAKKKYDCFSKWG